MDKLNSDQSSESAMRLRHKARLCAVQALYQMEITGLGVRATSTEFRNHRFGHKTEKGYISVDEEFFEDLITGVVKQQDEIDELIKARLAKGWTLKRLDATLRALMRCASYEIKHRNDVPAIVIIDEYVGVASDFFEDKDLKFVNGSLDRIAKNLRPTEFGIIG